MAAPVPTDLGSRATRSALIDALRDLPARLPLGFRPTRLLYSGGLDSSLLAQLFRDVPGLRLVVVGTDSARDRADARSGAARLGLPLDERAVDGRALDRWLADAEWEIGTVAEPTRSVRAAVAVALSECVGESVLIGQGADELFFGYAHFRGLAPDRALARRREDLRKLVEVEWPWTERVAARIGCAVHAPYLDPTIVEVALRIAPPGIDDPRAKVELREAAVALGLDPELARRPKRALQYGSGIAREIARRVRTSGHGSPPRPGAPGQATARR